MRSKLVAAAVLATCAMALGAPAAQAQQDGGSSEPDATGPALTTRTDPTTTDAEPAESPEPTDDPQGSPIEVTLALNPGAAVPGQKVIVTAACDDPDGAALTSPVLEPVVLTAAPEGHQPWALHGTTSVTQDAQPGDYEVSADCDGGAVSTTLTVLPVGGDDSDAGASAGDQREGDQREGDQVERVPDGAPETGGGPPSDPLALLLTTAGLAGAAGLGGIAARRVARR